jgi:hypothetical protein
VPAIFFTDAVLTAAAAWLLAGAAGHCRNGWLEAGLAWCWSLVALVAGAGVILGMTGGFGPLGFLAFHAAALAVLLLARRRHLDSGLGELRTDGREAREFFNSPGRARVLGLGLVVSLALLAIIAASAQPAVLDALTYHLPRIGHWLQDGRIRMLDTSDARLNFVAVLPDIVMAWFVGATREGFRLAVVPQALGGIMAVGATVGMARQSGLGRATSILAGFLLLGMANVVVQFTAAQTDLFTTGVFAVSFYLWVAALRRGEASVLAALGAGLALGSKGTLFYLAPSAVLWVALLAQRYPLPWPQWRTTLIAAVLGIALFALPAFVRNWQAYGSALGPTEWVKRHHQGFDSLSGQLHKLELNLASGLAQNFDPQSQPWGLRSLSRDAGLAIVRELPPDDRYTLHDLDRRSVLEDILQRDEPDADATSFGTLTLLLFGGGSFFALARWWSGRRSVALVWSTGVVVFLLFFYVMQQWHPFGFRYFVLVAPWVAIVSAWGIEQLSRRSRIAVWAVVLFATLDVGWRVTARTGQAGWQSVVRPEGHIGCFVESGWRGWSARLDHPADPYRLALAEERPTAAFYRQWPRRAVVYQPDPGMGTAEQLLAGGKGWLIVPAERFVGREGAVKARVWLFQGDEASPYSLAAYRTLDAGEKLEPIFYRQRRTVAGNAVMFDLLVKSFDDLPLRLAFANPGRRARGYVWSTPLAEGRGLLAGGAKVVLSLPLSAAAVGQVRILFDAPRAEENEQDVPTMERVP